MLERINSNLFERQISGVDDNVDSYEKKVDKLVRRIDLLENRLNHYVHKLIVFAIKKYSILNVIQEHAKLVFVILVKLLNMRDALAVTLVRIVRDIICHISVELAFL